MFVIHTLRPPKSKIPARRLGPVPLGGNDVWLHALLGLALAAVGFTAREVPRTV